MTRGAVDRLLLCGALVFALAGVAALVRPARVDVAPSRLALAAPPAVSADTSAADDSALVDAVVRANVFSDTRRPPAVRYDPTGAAQADAAPAAMPLGAPPSADSAGDAAHGAEETGAPSSSAVPSLFGIVAEPQGAVALLRLDPHIPGARAYHAGDRGGAWRVVRVGDREVVLDGPAGRRTLRLAAPRTPR